MKGAVRLKLHGLTQYLIEARVHSKNFLCSFFVIPVIVSDCMIMLCNNSYMSGVDYVTCESSRVVSFPPCALVIASSPHIRQLVLNNATLYMVVRSGI